MDHDRFDAVARAIASRSSRRAIGLLAAGGLAASMLDLADAKKKKKKKKKKRGCLEEGANCASDGACCGDTCCAGECASANRICCLGLTGSEFTCLDNTECCDPETSNFDRGCAPIGAPVCCVAPASSGQPALAWPAGTVCCDSPEDGENGACPSATPVCVAGGGCTT